MLIEANAIKLDSDADSDADPNENEIAGASL
jgi:hypothetical protein